MIIKMRKMDLLLYHREQEKFLEELRNLGVVHIASDEPPESTVAQELSASVHLSNRVIAALQKVQKEKNITAAAGHHGNAFEVIREFEEYESKKDRAGQEILSLKKDRESLLPWGNFEPQAVKRLADAGLEMKFYTMTLKKFESLDKSKYGIELISQAAPFAYFVVVYRGEAPEIAGAEEVRLPEASLKTLDEKIASLQSQCGEINTGIERLIGGLPVLEKFRDEHLGKLRYEEARLSMKTEAQGKLLKLSGWVPKANEAKVTEFVNKNHSAYIAFRDPAPNENVPVKLKNDKYSKLFEPVLGIYSLPNYSELDYTVFAAPFFTIFFGLCLGDAGYGLMVTLIAIIGMLALSAKMRPILMLGLVLGVSTTACGILLNSFFGMPIFGGMGVEPGTSIFATGAEIFAPLAAYNNEGGQQVFPALSLALVAGFAQLFLGMLIQSYMQMRDRGFAAGLQPIACIIMAVGGIILGGHTNFMNLGIADFSVGALQIGPALMAAVSPGVAKGMAIGGLIMLLLFNNVDKIIFMRPLTGLWALYNFATGFISNVLSYLRLFALGLAGGLLAAAVNQIAFMFITAPDGTVNFKSIWVVGTIGVLIGGHIVNLGFSALGAFIHPLRLTFVEFYGVVGFKGGSKPYSPFANVKQQ
ncbi:MAG: hypothetical protein LBI42_02120 [Chitinispirillales bacterium]|jgi:V/A-type H+-transporting ATPase subunit I|nr:hypothetical protein [Chitinispirillales bacterium]